MGEKNIEVGWNSIIINDKKILTNYLYKFIILLIQRELDEDEIVFYKVLGEDGVSSLLDILENQEDFVNSPSFTPDRFNGQLTKIGYQVLDLPDSIDNYEWIIDGKTVCLDRYKLQKHSATLFDNLIMPYLQLDFEDKITIHGTDNSVIKFFLYHLKRNRYLFNTKKTDIYDLQLSDDNSFALERIDEKRFRIKNDLLGVIPLNIHIIMNNKKTVTKTIELTFPFFIKNDMVTISVYQNDQNWYISAINENNGTKYTREISL